MLNKDEELQRTKTRKVAAVAVKAMAKSDEEKRKSEWVWFVGDEGCVVLWGKGGLPKNIHAFLRSCAYCIGT